MNNTLIQLYNIEPHKKLDKLDEEDYELSIEICKYIHEPTKENIRNTILEWIDTGSVLLQLAKVDHGISVEEVEGMAKSTLKTSLRIANLMKETKVDYQTARKIVRG